MSRDDVETETKMAATAWADTSLPLLGLTMAGDSSLSARSWTRRDVSEYAREHHTSVRVVGEQLSAAFNPDLAPAPEVDGRMRRTVSAWGPENQAVLSRLRVAVAGVGSVGMLVGEALIRSGVRHLTLIDFDSVETHNLDRLAHATIQDAETHRAKVDVAREALLALAPTDGVVIDAREASVVEHAGYSALLDCDLAFSCVDRPWPRQALDHLAFAHLIPVVDGGVAVSVRGGRLASADWRAHVVDPSRRCMSCAGQYTPADVALERAGDLDRPSYIRGLPADHPVRASENVYAFSQAVASLEVLQALSLIVAPQGIGDVGAWNFHFVIGRMDVTMSGCNVACPHQNVIAQADSASAPLVEVHPIAEAARQQRKSRASSREQPFAVVKRFLTVVLARLRRFP